MAQPDETETSYRRLWKRFYDTIAIKERENPRCRQTHMPKRYWNTMTEFQSEEYFISGKSSEISNRTDTLPTVSITAD